MHNLQLNSASTQHVHLHAVSSPTPVNKLPPAIWKEIATKFLNGTLIFGSVHRQFLGMTHTLSTARKWEKKCAERTSLQCDPFRRFIREMSPNYIHQQPLWQALHILREQTQEPWRQVHVQNLFGTDKDRQDIEGLGQLAKRNRHEGINLPGGRDVCITNGHFTIKDNKNRLIADIDTTQLNHPCFSSRGMAFSSASGMIATGLSTNSRIVFWSPDMDPILKLSSLSQDQMELRYAQNPHDTMTNFTDD